MSEIINGTAAELRSFTPPINAVVVGASGGIGRAFADALDACPQVSRVLRFARSTRPDPSRGSGLLIDLEDENMIAAAAEIVRRSFGSAELVIVATGVLHDGERLQPEKSWRTLSGPAMEVAFRVNSIGPALVAKHFLPLLVRGRKTVFGVLSARVGSIEDNVLGGWFSYRASKAALNMLVKTLSIELARHNPDALCVGLHPGTVDSALSKPFQGGVREDQLFPPERSAHHLLNVIDGLSPVDTGSLFAWDGKRIPF